MEKYEQLSVVGEGSYGIVLKCRHRDTEQIVAIKKFLETEEDATVRRMALREIRMLKRLKHENLITMIEVFRYRKRFYLVFEYLEGTVLDELEKMPNGLGDDRCRERIYQVIRAINYCHSNHILHRDVKPENVLVSSLGVVKLCDFGFARLVSPGGEPCTEYVATRWYRAPELLVGENNYGPPVDVWAIGCLFAEMMTGDPLFPGESDIDQLYLIIKLLGKPCVKHQHLMSKTSQLRGMLRSAASDAGGLYKTFNHLSLLSLDFLACCLKMDPSCRPTAEELLRHNYFLHDRFPQRFLPALREKVTIEFNNNPLLRRFKTEVLMSTDKKDEIKPRRSSQIEAPPRWKFNFTEGSVKRKFSCDTIGSDILAGDKSSNLSSRSSQKSSLTPQQKSGQFLFKQSSFSKNSSKQSVSTPKLTQSTLEHGKSTEIQKLEKSLECLSKLSRPTSTQKEEKSARSPIQPSSHSPQFQSLQTTLIDYNKSPSLLSQSIQNVLHPSINNISFGKEPQKKSPNMLQSLQNTSIKTTFNQVPLLNPPRGSFLKKLDRNVTIDNMLSNIEPVCIGSSISGPPWLNSLTAQNKKKEQKLKSDNFTLPELPGATSSPNKPTKKTSPEIGDCADVTPRIQSSTSQKSASSKLLNGLPFK